MLLGNGDGTFQPAVSYLLPGGEYDAVAIGDVNGDGYPDLVLVEGCQRLTPHSCKGTGEVAVLLGNGDGTFQSPQKFSWIEADQLSEKLIVALEQNSPLGKLLAIGLANRHRSRALMVERLEDGGRHVVHELERFLNTLGTIAAIAPLLGLLGTVAGIIHAFNAITANGLGDPRILSGGIGEALITTAAGLTVAIPSLIAYRYLRGKVERLVIRMEKEAMKLVDALDARGDLAAEN